MIDHNHFICHLILGTFTEYPENDTPATQGMLIEKVKEILSTGIQMI